MTIQAGLTGPPHAPGLRVRVWSDRPGNDVTVLMANTGAPVPGVSITPMPVPFEAVDPSLPRRIVEIGSLPADTLVRISMAGENCTVLTPPGIDGELRLLVGSCFFLPDDRGKLTTAFENLRQQDVPHIRLHGGDQIYLDAGPLPPGPNELARTLVRYRQYWNDPTHSRYLRAGVTLFSPDDHDYWNDYPFSMPHLDRSWSGKWKKHEAAARLGYYAYQALGNPAGKSWFVLDLGIVSLFVLDTRSQRTSKDRRPPPQLFDDAQRQALLNWSATLQKPGLLLSAMPLFQKSTGKVLLGLITGDHNLLWWQDDARHIWRAVENAPYSVLVLAGDIHRGVISQWRTARLGSVRQNYEVVASPLSLLGYPVKGSRKSAVQPGGLQLGGGLGRRDVAATYYGTSADHFALLRLKRVAEHVEVRVSAHCTPSAMIPKSEIGARQPCSATFHLRREA